MDRATGEGRVSQMSDNLRDRIAAKPEFRVGDNVRIGNGRKVYQIGNGRKVYQISAVKDGTYQLAASSWHADAAKRVPDALRWYRPEELTEVRPRR